MSTQNNGWTPTPNEPVDIDAPNLDQTEGTIADNSPVEGCVRVKIEGWGQYDIPAEYVLPQGRLMLPDGGMLVPNRSSRVITLPQSQRVQVLITQPRHPSMGQIATVCASSCGLWRLKRGKTWLEFDVPSSGLLLLLADGTPWIAPGLSGYAKQTLVSLLSNVRDQRASETPVGPQEGGGTV